MGKKDLHVRYLSLKTGRTEKIKIREQDQHEVWKRQRLGEISIISVSRSGKIAVGKG